MQTFDDMNAPLLSTGKLVKDGDAIVVMDKPDTHVITGNTKTTIQNIVKIAATSNPDDIMLKVPFNEQSLTWRTVGNDDTGSIFHGDTNGPGMHSTTTTDKTAHNVHRIRSKEVLVDFLHRCAGYPMKKTWLAAIKKGFYATWPGLTAELVSKYLPADTEEAAAGHLHR